MYYNIQTSCTPHYENIRANRMQNQTCLSSAEVQPNEGVANAPFEIPASWEWCKIANLGEIVTGTTPSKLVGEYYNGEYPFYKPTDLEQGINTLTSSDSLTLAGLEASRCLPKESILVTCIGATIGKTGVIQREGSCNQQINAIIPYSHSNPLYIYYCIISGFMQNAIKSNASATTLPILNKTDFSNLLFPLPPFDEQKRIVAEVERWFVLIDEIEAHKSDLQEYIKQAKSKVLDIAIHGKLVPQDPNDEPAVELLKRINPNAPICDTSHYENLPKNWAITTMSNLCKIIDGEKQSNINRIYLDVKFLRGKSDGEYMMSGKYVPANSTMILVDGENSGEIFTTTIDGYQGSTFKILDISEEMYKPFVLYVILSYQKQLRENKVGSAIPHLNKKLFREIVVEVPPYEEQKRIVNKIDELFSFIDSILLEL